MIQDIKMTEDDFMNFSDVFSEVLTVLDDDPIEHFIVLTYELDEQQLLNLATLRPLEEAKEIGKSALKILSGIRPVIFFDARKTRPFGRLPQFLELHPLQNEGILLPPLEGLLHRHSKDNQTGDG